MTWREKVTDSESDDVLAESGTAISHLSFPPASGLEDAEASQRQGNVSISAYSDDFAGK